MTPLTPQVAIAIALAMLATPRESPTLRTIKAKRRKAKAASRPGAQNATIVAALGEINSRFEGAPMLPTGELPEQARLAGMASKFGPNNDIHRKDAWFCFGSYSDRWFSKRARLRFYAKPPSAKFVVQTTHHRNVAWMARCPEQWYPGHGKARPGSCRVDAITRWIGPKAEWKAWTEAFKTSIDGIPDVLKAAGVVVGAIFSFGGTALVKTEKQVDTVSKGITAALEPIGDVGRSWRKRLEASEQMIRAINDRYLAQMKDANPWCVRADGVFDTSKRYLKNPRTWEDLRVARQGEQTGYPLLYNPPRSPQ